jgi:hypothetical protein
MHWRTFKIWTSALGQLLPRSKFGFMGIQNYLVIFWFRSRKIWILTRLKVAQCESPVLKVRYHSFATFLIRASTIDWGWADVHLQSNISLKSCILLKIVLRHICSYGATFFKLQICSCRSSSFKVRNGDYGHFKKLCEPTSVWSKGWWWWASYFKNVAL